MNLLLVAILVIIFSLALSVWACMATRYASNGRAGPRIDEVFRFALASGFIATPVMLHGLEQSDPATASVGLFLGILLGVSATIDRLTAWAPDGLIVPISVLACVYGPIGDIHILWGVVAGLGLFVVAQLLWMLQVSLDRRALPPPDIIAVLLPFALFGFSIHTIIVLLTVALILLAILRWPHLEIFSGLQDAKDDAQQDTGIKGGNTVAFLATAFPVTLVIWAASHLGIFTWSSF